jgi:hypothetical protein
MTSIMERTSIRSQLKLRYNAIYHCWEVYTAIHGAGGLLKWVIISKKDAEWYWNTFPELRDSEASKISIHTNTVKDVLHDAGDVRKAA